MSTSMRFPPLLSAGARVALVAPSGPLRDAGDLERAMNNARELGWDAVPGAHVLERDGYFAGRDAHRLADFVAAAADDSIDGIWCIRGGYGAMRLLHGIDYDVWRWKPRALIGYSDITALHAAIGARADLVTYHGPTARAVLTDVTRESLVAAVSSGASPYVVRHDDTVTLRAGCARGRLAGGNLALVASLVGTPYAVDLDGAILVLEDVNEAVYRIDRMLTQLALSGALAKCAGIVFGRFTEIPPDTNEAERPLSLERILQEAADRCGVPCIANAPFGHVDDQFTLPLGATAVLDADQRTIIIER
jgi:muramoyltetrapeptide carboxypeptidase